MSAFRPFSIALFTTFALSTRAQTTADPSDNSPAPITLDRFVVSEKLDKAREDIVPSLGAAEFRIDRAQLNVQPLGINASFNEVLLRVPGFVQDSFGQVHLRGEHADLQYRINDVLLPEGLSGFGQELDTRFAESVNVLTGALPAQYGYRTAGVVDIHTRSAAAAGAELTVSGGSFATMGASAESSASYGKFGAYVTASGEQNNQGIENPTRAQSAIHDRKDQAKSFGYFSYVIDDSSRINLMYSVSFARFQIPNNPGQKPVFELWEVPNFDSASLDEHQREENHYAIVSYQKSTTDFSLQLSAFSRYSFIEFTPDVNGDLIFNGVASGVRRALVGNGIEADSKWALGSGHVIRSGLVITSANAYSRTRTAVFAANVDGSQASVVPYSINDDQRRLGWLSGAYLQDEWKLAQRVTLNCGARIDASRGYLSESQLSPRANLVYSVNKRLTAHVGYARYFTPPPLELVQNATIGRFAGTTNQPENPLDSPVRSERANYFDAGLAATLTSHFTATIDGYDKQVTNLLDEGQFGQAVILSPFNFRRGRIAGVEISANFSSRGFSAYANAAVSHAVGRDIVSGQFLFGTDELAYIRSHDVHLDHDQLYTTSVGTSYKFRRDLIYLDLLFGSGLRRGFANTEHLPEYHPINVGVEHTFKLVGRRVVRARVDVVNVFDDIYQLRDGSGIGVGAPQYGSRRGVFGSLTYAY